MYLVHPLKAPPPNLFHDSSYMYVHSSVRQGNCIIFLSYLLLYIKSKHLKAKSFYFFEAGHRN